MQCQRCTFKDQRQVPGQFPEDPQFNCLWVGQAPGKTEERTGRPFTGSAGKMEYSIMNQVGIIKAKQNITNVILCKPPADNKGNDRAPNPLEIECCQAHLQAEIQSLRPELIIALGGTAAEVLTGRVGISSLRGTYAPLSDSFGWKCPVFFTYHPSFVMRSRQYIPVSIMDHQKVVDFFMYGPPEVMEEKYVLDPTSKALERFFYGVETSTPLAVDTETTGLNPRKDQVIGASFSRGSNHALAVNLVRNDSRLPIIRRALEDEKIPKIFQNGSYDCEILLHSLGITVRGLYWDTRLAEQLINPDMPHNLDHLRAIYTSMEPYKPSKKEMKFIQSWGKERMLTYAAKDALCTYLVYEKQKEILTEGQITLMQTILLPIVPILNQMERKGMEVDIPRLAVMYAYYLPIVEGLEREIYEATGINPHSPKQVMNYFKTTSSDKETLEALITRGHLEEFILRKVIDVRKLKRDLSTNLIGVHDRLVDGRIHTTYYPDGTGTGRLSSSNPNLQNVPKEMRVIYKSDEGKVILSGDYRQLELWVVAILSGCEVLLGDLKEGVDVHGRVQAMMQEFIPLDQTHRSRLIAKTVVFGTLYGRSYHTIARAFHVPEITAQSWQEACFAQYPGLRLYTEARTRDLQERGYVTTPWGRWRKVDTFMQACNTPVQSTAADVCLSTMIELDRVGGFDMRLQVHDEIVLQCPREELEATARRAKAIFEREIPQLNNSFPAEFKYGENWYEMEELKL